MYKKIIALLLYTSVFAAQTLPQAQYFLDHSNYKNAVTIYEQLKEKGQKTNNISLLVKAQNGIADCYMDLGASYKAMAVLKQNIALVNQQKNKDLLLLAQTHQLLANCYDKLNLTEDYLTECNLFYNCYKKAFPDKDIYKALYYAYLGRYYNLRFLIHKGFYCTDKAISIFNKNKKDSGLIDVYLLYNAHSFSSRNHKTKVGDKFIYADSLRYFLNKRFPYDNAKKARAIISIAAINLDEAAINLHQYPNNLTKGNYNANKAIAYYNQALALNYKFIGYYNPNSAHVNALKGLMYFYKKDYKSALKYYNEGINQLSLSRDLKQNSLYNNNPIMISLLNWKAWCLDDKYIQNKDTKLLYEIESTLLLMENVWLQYTNDIIKNKKQYNINGYISSPYNNQVKNYCKLYKATGKERYLALFYKYDEKSKYSTLLEILYKEKKAQANKAILEKQLMGETFEDLVLKINAKIPLKQSKEHYEKLFNKQFENYNIACQKNDVFSTKEVISLKAAQQNLKDNEAVLSYNFAGNQNEFYPYLFLITKHKAQIIDLKEEYEIYDEKSEVESLVAPLKSNDIHLYKKLALEYYTKYFEPIERHLPKTVQHIQIVPSPNFANLPFDILLTQETKNNDYRKLPYLGKKYQFSYALSASISRFTNKIASGSNNFSVFSPSFSQKFNQLDHASKTAESISNSYDAKLINKSSASKKSFSEHLNQDQIVVLLSHGKSSSNEDETQKGIYLSDGFLSLNEVYNLHSSCDFLLLGTCESGVGYKNHEGNISLARAFTAIGVKSMMLSSWEIDEVSSTQIITSFIDYLSQGFTKSEALQKAKMDFLATANPKTANPIYWAGLNSIGNNDTIELRKNYSIYWWIILILASITGGFLYYRKKRN
ncbi:CHAT domain-containing tetratricopeptide repeat protein [Flavobacterium sp.]|uniref:CHAT domain-containing protein n=1 Tax=Flavobacterium sp. TaxID=239 RepID=UPI001B7156C9|nr:CHAT domain-containing tetratricopeptide repeat protein [Flavobacterium sp.]MBP6181420.1 CHAT domain-containing protein [Flavobacterium sp.]